MINFAVGPVQMEDAIRTIGSEQLPYFRTPEFSALMKENESLICEFAGAQEGARAVFLTASGTAAMEAAVINLFDRQDKLLIINGGSFGVRFVKICRIHGIPFTELVLETGRALTADKLIPFEKQGYTGFLVNVHETSTGVYYDMDLIADFCRRNSARLVVDAISSFLADAFYMEKWGVDAMLTGSQKALALPPGISLIVFNRASVERVMELEPESLYFDMKDYLKDGERGQTPFTPAVGILLQMNKRLRMIKEKRIEAELKRTAELAADFRERIKALPLEIASEALSSAETPLHPTGRYEDGSLVSAYRIFEVLKNEYDIFVCPNGGALADQIFRVGHIGNLTIEDNETLVKALYDLQNRGLL